MPIPAIIGAIAPAAADNANKISTQITGPLIAEGMNAIFHNTHLKQQGDYQDLQIAGEKELTDYNAAKSLEMWKATNYPAQMEQLKEAGLNPGLLYGGTSGTGGTTGFSGGNSVTGQTAPKTTETMAMGLMLNSQLALMNAQKENIEADTANKKSQVPVNEANVSKTGAETKNLEANLPKIGAEKENIETDTQLKQSQIKINDFNATIAEWESKLKENTYSLEIGKLDAEYKNLVANTKLTESQINEVNAKITNLAVQNAFLKSGQQLNEQKVNESKAITQSILTGISQRWEEIYNKGIESRAIEREIGEKLTNSGISSDAAQELTTLILSIGAVANKYGKNAMK